MAETLDTANAWQAFLDRVPRLAAADCDGADCLALFTAPELALIIKAAVHRRFALHGDSRDAKAFLSAQAGRYDLLTLYRGGEFDGQLPHDAWEQFGAKLAAIVVEPERAFLTNHLGYLVFPDRSLYVASNATDEVWADVGDYIADYPEHVRVTLEGDERALLDWYHGED
jgi:hypothetical protein